MDSKIKKYRISIDGCDDSTRFEIELTDEQREVVEMLCEKSFENSTSRCMPTMEMTLITQKKRSKCENCEHFYISLVSRSVSCSKTSNHSVLLDDCSDFAARRENMEVDE
jgi:hypothetical protein